MPRKNKILVVVMIIFFAIAIVYNVRRVSKGSTKNGGKEQQEIQTPQTQVARGAGVSMNVEGAYVLIEGNEDLLEYEVRSSTRNPFESMALDVPPDENLVKSEAKDEKLSAEQSTVAPASESVKPLQNSDPASSTLTRADAAVKPQVEIKNRSDQIDKTKSEEKSLQKPQPQTLEIKGIITSSLGKCVIVSDRVFSEGDYIGDELLVEVRSDSIVLEGEGGRRELKLKQPPTSVEVRRSRQ